MEILILLLLLGFIALVFFTYKYLTDEDKQKKNLEDAKGRKISDLEAEMARKDVEMKKMMEERQKMEDEFFKAKDEASVYKKDNAELTVKVKQSEKAREESAELKAEMKQKDLLLQQETVARQKLQGEVSLRDTEADKLHDELDKLRGELKAKTEMHEGLKGQFNELESEVQKTREAALKKPEPPKQEPPKQEPPKQEPPKPELPKPEPAKLETPKADLPKVEAPKVESPKQVIPPKLQPAEPVKAEFEKKEDLPGFPKQEPPLKVEIKHGVPSDMDFLKVEPAQKSEEIKNPEESKKTQVPNKPQEPSSDIPAGAFKITNVNKPSASPKPLEKDKQKSKKETLIPGFQPPKKHDPEEPA